MIRIFVFNFKNGEFLKGNVCTYILSVFCLCYINYCFAGGSYLA